MRQSSEQSIRPEEKIARLQDQLEFRNRFQRMVVHDLRGPATAIKLGSEFALKGVKQMLRSNFKQNAIIKTKLSDIQMNTLEGSRKVMKRMSTFRVPLDPGLCTSKIPNIQSVRYSVDEDQLMNKSRRTL